MAGLPVRSLRSGMFSPRFFPVPKGSACRRPAIGPFVFPAGNRNLPVLPIRFRTGREAIQNGTHIPGQLSVSRHRIGRMALVPTAAALQFHVHSALAGSVRGRLAGNRADGFSALEPAERRSSENCPRLFFLVSCRGDAGLNPAGERGKIPGPEYGIPIPGSRSGPHMRNGVACTMGIHLRRLRERSEKEQPSAVRSTRRECRSDPCDAGSPRKGSIR